MAVSSQLGARFNATKLRELEALALIARTRASGLGIARQRSRALGSGIEFADHRAYEAGDDPRQLDWHVYARTERLLIRLFEENKELEIDFLVDYSASMTHGSPPKFLAAVDTALALAYVGLRGLDRVRWHAMRAGKAELLGNVRGQHGFSKLLKHADQECRESTNFVDSVRAYGKKRNHADAVFIVSDFYDRDYAQALRLLRAHFSDVRAIHIWDPHELKPLMRGDARLIGIERLLTSDRIFSEGDIRKIERAFSDFHNALRSTCRSLEIPYLRVACDVSLSELTPQLLAEKGFLH